MPQNGMARKESVVLVELLTSNLPQICVILSKQIAIDAGGKQLPEHYPSGHNGSIYYWF